MTLMGDVDAEAPTEFAGLSEAWSEDDGEEWVPPRSWRPVIAAGTVSAGLVLAVTGLAIGYFTKDTGSVSSEATTTTVVTESKRPLPTFTPRDVPAAHTINPPPPELIPGTGMTATEVAAWDRTFMARMQAQGWGIDDPGLFAHRAHQVCAMLQKGDPPILVQQRMSTQFEGINPVGAYQFVNTAMNTYPDCP